MKEILYEYQNYINMLYSVLFMVLPIFALVNKSGKKLNYLGWWFMVLAFSFLCVSIFFQSYSEKIIKSNDLKIKISLRSNDGGFAISDLPDNLPEKISIPYIKIDRYETAGTLFFEKQSVGKGRSRASVFVNYTCVVPIDVLDEVSPNLIDEINPGDVSIFLNLDDVLKNNYRLNGGVTLSIRDKEYLGIRKPGNFYEFIETEM